MSLLFNELPHQTSNQGVVALLGTNQKNEICELAYFKQLFLLANVSTIFRDLRLFGNRLSMDNLFRICPII